MSEVLQNIKNIQFYLNWPRPNIKSFITQMSYLNYIFYLNKLILLLNNCYFKNYNFNKELEKINVLVLIFGNSENLKSKLKVTSGYKLLIYR